MSEYQKKNKLHIVAVTAAIRNTDGQYLVLKRSVNETAFPEAWCFPGGKVEDNQTIDEALREEIEEETGLAMKAGKVPLTDTSFVRPDGQSVKVFVYLCQVEPGEVVFDKNDFEDARWISPDEVSSLEHVGIDGDIAAAEKVVASGLDLSALAIDSK